MPKVQHMPKFSDVHFGGKYSNKYATYEVAPINDEVRIAVQRQCQ